MKEAKGPGKTPGVARSLRSALVSLGAGGVCRGFGCSRGGLDATCRTAARDAHWFRWDVAGRAGRASAYGQVINSAVCVRVPG